MKRKRRALRIFPGAAADLDDISRYTAARWSRRRADRYIGELSSAMKALAAGRRIGRSAGVGEALKLPAGAHMIIYWLRPESVDVVRVLHGAMDVIKHVDPDEG